MSTRRSRRQRAGSSSNAAAATKRPRISFIIPALNEERFIVDTVRQFSQLDGVIDYEVIVADGGSSDKTVEIASQWGARTVVDTSEKKTIASGRNLGAEIANGELLIFCDADTRLENIDAFTACVLNVFRDDAVVGAIPRLEVFPNERRWQDRLFSAFLNRWFRMCFFIGCPYAGGQCQVVRRKSFHAVHGYNRDQVHGEDSALFQKLGRVGRLRFMWDVTVFESPRRYRKLGYFKLIMTGLTSIMGQKIYKRNVLTSWERVD